MAHNLKDGRKRQFWWIENEGIDGNHIAKMGAIPWCLYCVIVRHADQEGKAFPSFGYMMEKTGICRQTVNTAIKKLIKLGYIRKLKKGNSHGYANLYEIVDLASVKPLPAKKKDAEVVYDLDQSKKQTSLNDRQKVVYSVDSKHTQYEETHTIEKEKETALDRFGRSTANTEDNPDLNRQPMANQNPESPQKFPHGKSPSDRLPLSSSDCTNSNIHSPNGSSADCPNTNNLGVNSTSDNGTNANTNHLGWSIAFFECMAIAGWQPQTLTIDGKLSFAIPGVDGTLPVYGVQTTALDRSNWAQQREATIAYIKASLQLTKV